MKSLSKTVHSIFIAACTIVLTCRTPRTSAFAILHPSHPQPLAGEQLLKADGACCFMHLHKHKGKNKRRAVSSRLFMEDNFQKIDENDDQIIAFIDSSVDEETTNAIDCYVDSYASIDGVAYTVGHPCDYAVALCYFDGQKLVPVELDDKLMDDIFPVAEQIIEDEFGEELVLLRTPQTLTLAGELEESEIDEDEDGEGLIGSPEDEDVELLVSFEENGQDYHLARLLDPVLLVGKNGTENTRLLLTPEESDEVLPRLEELFLNSQGLVRRDDNSIADCHK